MDIMINEEQFGDMKHCIGFDGTRVKRRKYKAYRNFYDVGTNSSVSWEDLLQKGLACKNTVFGNTVYHLTSEGIKFLERTLEVKIEEID